jgi:hypothetical protein
LSYLPPGHENNLLEERPIKRRTYIQQPKGFEEKVEKNKMCTLLKALYGHAKHHELGTLK